MTPFEKQQIRTLVWKEWRQVRMVVGMAVLILVIMPLMPLWSPIQIQDAFYTGTAIAFLMLSFGLGVVPYGMELNDHTNAYLITRPVDHWKVFMVKLLLSLVPVWILALIGGIQLAIGNHPGEMNPWRLIFAPMIFLAVQFFILLIPPMVPALILSVSAGLLAVWYLMIAPALLLPVLCSLFLAGSYMLAGKRMRGPGW
jgi:hypothetical protein